MWIYSDTVLEFLVFFPKTNSVNLLFNSSVSALPSNVRKQLKILSNQASPAGLTGWKHEKGSPTGQGPTSDDKLHKISHRGALQGKPCRHGFSSSSKSRYFSSTRRLSLANGKSCQLQNARSPLPPLLDPFQGSTDIRRPVNRLQVSN